MSRERLEEIAADIERFADEPAPPDRMTVPAWHQMVTDAAFAGWRRSGLRIGWYEAYALVDAALHHALPERAPLITP